MCTLVGQSAPLAMCCYGALTTITLVSAYQTVRCIPLATLNSTRLQVRGRGGVCTTVTLISACDTERVCCEGR